MNDKYKPDVRKGGYNPPPKIENPPPPPPPPPPPKKEIAENRRAGDI
jgi:hypothetical protein